MNPNYCNSLQRIVVVKKIFFLPLLLCNWAISWIPLLILPRMHPLFSQMQLDTHVNPIRPNDSRPSACGPARLDFPAATQTRAAQPVLKHTSLWTRQRETGVRGRWWWGGGGQRAQEQTRSSSEEDAMETWQDRHLVSTLPVSLFAPTPLSLMPCPVPVYLSHLLSFLCNFRHT